MSPAALSARTYVRYAVPLTVLTALAFAPLLYLAWRAKLPATISEGKSAVRLAWGLLAASLLPMLVLVGGVAPAVRSVATGQPASQLRAFGDGVRGLVAAMVPCALAFMAALLGMLALVVPGLVLLVLFALVGASSGAGAGRLAEAAAVARGRRTALAIAGVLLATLVLHAAAVWFVQRGLAVPLPKKPTPAQLGELRTLVRTSVIASAVIAPFAAIALAAIHARGEVRP
ncbi:MAG TPA: hypothetical protein VM513_14470 [Kofleriaceae bacterium]|nr:hypothetical protein [Kofleriaceae bacterium]